MGGSSSTMMPMPRMIKMGGTGKMVGGSTMKVTSTSTTSSQPRMIKMGGTGKMIRMGSSSTMMPMPRMMKMGGTGKMMGGSTMMRSMGMMKRSPSPMFNMSGQKATLINPEQNEKFHPSAYGA